MNRLKSFLIFHFRLFSVRALITKFGEKIKALEKTYNYLGKENVDELVGKLALRADEYIRKRFGKKKAVTEAETTE